MQSQKKADYALKSVDGNKQVRNKARESQLSANLCYCVPEFSNLDIADLPDTNELMKELAAKLDYSCNNEIPMV